MKIRNVFAVVTAAVLSSAAMGQSMNIDVNTQQGIPSNAYGAAAGQPGFWNSITAATAGFTTPLMDLNGNATSAMWSNLTNAGLFNFNNAGTSGDDQALMDDGFDLGTTGPDAYSITGLINGTYSVYVYAWAPDSADFITSVSVNGAAAQLVGGAWSGSHQQGVTYALFENVLVSNGSINIDLVPTGGGFGTLNGVQLIVPAPGALALLGLAGLAGTRRRRA